MNEAPLRLDENNLHWYVPPNSAEYCDAEGNPCTLDVLCVKEPAWAANRIRAGLANIERLEQLVGTMHVAAVKRSVEFDALKKEADAAEREADRLRHGEPIESDFICPSELQAFELRKVMLEVVIPTLQAYCNEDLHESEGKEALATCRAALEETMPPVVDTPPTICVEAGRK